MSDSNIRKRHHAVFGEIDTVVDENGNILYDAPAVAAALGYKYPHVIVSQQMPEQPLVETGQTTAKNGTVFHHRKRFCTEKAAFMLALKAGTPQGSALRDWIYEAVFPLLDEFSRDWLRPYDKEKETVVNLIFAAVQATNVEPSKFAEAYTNNLNRLTKD